MPDRDTGGARETRVVYTCWPFGSEGHRLCGLLLIVVGAAMLAEVVVPYPSEAIWGVALTIVGAWMLTRTRRREDRW